MTFLNMAMLFGLLALAVPILIHLLNRNQARPIQWGAMRFLLASIVARSRRLLIEDILLLVLRCLVFAFVALAMARPFLPSRSSVPWELVLPAVLVAVVGMGVAAGVWTDRRMRRILVRIVAGLMIFAIGVSVAERWLQGRRWLGGGEGKDIVLVMDASASMTLNVEGRTSFDKGVDEAKAVISACRPRDAVGVILAGPVPRALVSAPTSDRKEILALLGSRDFHPVGGSMGVLEALNAAAALLAQGQNPAKEIIVITDGQSVGWDVQSEARWRFLADSLKSFLVRPRIVCRKLPLPKSFRNAAVIGIALSRKVVGPDRPVKIDVKIANSGNASVQPSAVDLMVDGTNVAREAVIKEILPAGAETIRFEHRFDRPGMHVIRAQIVGEDDLPLDNTAEWVVPVVDRIPVLVVDGTPSQRPLDGAASFLAIALTPRPENESKPGQDPSSRSRPEGGMGDVVQYLMEPKVIPVAELPQLTTFAPYRAVILANVPRLPSLVTDRLADYVKAGGGILLTPGNRAEPAFYNGWKTAAGEALVPAALAERRLSEENPARFELKTFSHPSLQLIAEAQNSDAASALLDAHWKLAADAQDPAVRIGGLLDSGEPFLVERQLGRGYVLMTSLGLDRRDSNLPTLKCFVPLIHEIVLYLAAPNMTDPNIRPGMEMAIELPTNLINLAVTPKDKAASTRTVEVFTPSEKRRPATVANVEGRPFVRFGETQEPGLYHVLLPAAGGSTNAEVSIPFVVLNQPEESTLTELSETDFATILDRVDLFLARSREEMLTTVMGGIPGQELWKFLAIGAILALLGEIALTRWIAVQRRFHMVETVELRSPAADMQAFRNRAKMLMGGSSK